MDMIIVFREIYDKNGKLNNKPTNIGTSTPEQPSQEKTAAKTTTQEEPAQKAPEGNFDGDTGLPLTPKGAELFKKQPEEQRQKTLEDAKKLGFGLDTETGIQTKLEDIPQDRRTSCRMIPAAAPVTDTSR